MFPNKIFIHFLSMIYENFCLRSLSLATFHQMLIDVASLIVYFSMTHILRHFTLCHFTQLFVGQNPLQVVLFETSIIYFSCFQDQLLSPQTNTKLFNMFCPYSYAFWETFQKVTHPITTPSQACLTLEFLSDRPLKSKCILLVYAIPINSLKSSSIV